MRYLREYEYIAQKEHFCDTCCSYIMPGEQYRGSVYANKNHVFVIKAHSNPSCDFPPDPTEKDRENSRLEKEIESTFKKAA
jgi:hypothetical protein